MEEYRNSAQQLSENAEAILNLFGILKQDFREYADRKARSCSLTGPQILLIDTLYKSPGINLQDLSEKLRMAKSNASVIVERLVSKGIVLREVPEENRRTVKIRLSPDFQEQYDELKYKQQYWSDMFRNATEDELLIIIRGLEQWHELLERSKQKEVLK
ncbi:MAG TPA: MarR family transcriptional regulator [Bacillota bacterium]|nr:MarR family transcriptional regulator [Bacillota bacterium]